MGFANPKILFFLFLLFPFLLLALFNFKNKRSILKDFISEKAYKKLMTRSGKETDFFKTILVTISLIFFIIAMAGPQWGEKFERIDIKGMEMLFLLDTSSSMNAEDLKPNRLGLSKEMIKSIVDNLQTDYIGLINFSGSAYVQCPLTIDYEVFKLLTEASAISPEEEQGTDFFEAFTLALKTLKMYPAGEKVVFFISDGEDLENRWESLLKEFKEKKIIVFTIGVGSESGAPIPIKDSGGNIEGWKKDLQGNIVKSRLDEKILIKIASYTGGRYFRITDSSGIDRLVKNLKGFERSVLKKKVKSFKVQRFQYPLFIGIILLIIETILTSKKVEWKKR